MATEVVEQKIVDVLLYSDDMETALSLWNLYGEDASAVSYYYVTTKPTENIRDFGEYGNIHIYYVEDENNLFAYGDLDGSGENKWFVMSEILFGLPYGGIISSAEEIAEPGYYVVMETGGEEETPVATITYNGSTIASLMGGQTATLKCAGMKMESDVVVEVDDGEGDFSADLYFEGGYAEVNLPNATKIRDYGFYYDKTITNIVMPKVTSIGKNSFGYCSNLAQSSLPSGLTSIGAYAFRDCSQLALTELPSGITQIDDEAFSNCSNLALTELPNGLKRIGTYAFCNCSNLALTELPSGITSIGQNAFMNCTKLAVSTLPSGVTYLNDSAFRGCTSIVSMEIPIGVTNVVGVPFRNCTGLVTVTFRGKPSFNSPSPFSGCTNLKTINVPWAEGEVSGAPWGATNATINYNYTGE